MTDIAFKKRVSVEEVEEGVTFQPKFDSNGLIPVITIEFETNEVLMHGYSNEEALRLTMSTKKAHYFSRSRNELWEKGEISGNFQKLKMLIPDCDKDTLLAVVEQIGVACHKGTWSCFNETV